MTFRTVPLVDLLRMVSISPISVAYSSRSSYSLILVCLSSATFRNGMMPSCSLRVIMIAALGFPNVDSEWTLGAQQLSMYVERRDRAALIMTWKYSRAPTRLDRFATAEKQMHNNRGFLIHRGSFKVIPSSFDSLKAVPAGEIKPLAARISTMPRTIHSDT
jgi:hypothetical protein